MASKTGAKWASEMVFATAHDLPLRDRAGGIDVVDPLAGVGVALGHGVDPQVAGLAALLGLAPLTNAHPGGAGLGVMDVVLTIGPRAPQVVDLGGPEIEANR